MHCINRFFSCKGEQVIDPLDVRFLTDIESLVEPVMVIGSESHVGCHIGYIGDLPVEIFKFECHVFWSLVFGRWSRAL